MIATDDSWEIRTQMTDPLAKEWALCAAAHQHRPHVFVVLFFDGAISAAVDPISGELGHADWSFDFIKKVRTDWSLIAPFIKKVRTDWSLIAPLAALLMGPPIMPCISPTLTG